MNKDGIRYPAIDQLVKRTKSKSLLVLGVAIRARQIQDGDAPLINNPKSEKGIGIALEEIYANKLEIK